MIGALITIVPESNKIPSLSTIRRLRMLMIAPGHHFAAAAKDTLTRTSWDFVAGHVLRGIFFLSLINVVFKSRRRHLDLRCLVWP